MDHTNPDWQSEMAAIWISQVEGIPIETARVLIQTPAYADRKQLGMQMAGMGALDYLLVQPTAATTTADTTVKDDATRAAEAGAAGSAEANQAAIAKVQADIKKIESEIAIAKTAEDRAAKKFELEQAQHELAVLSQGQANALAQQKMAFDVMSWEEGLKQTQRQQEATIGQSLLSSAAALTGPSNVPAFMRTVSGGRGILEQLMGGQPRAAFSRPQGTLQPMTVGQLLREGGMDTGQMGLVARGLGYL